MNINDIVILRKHDQYHHREVIGNRYIVTEIKKTELKLCAEESNDLCFYTSPNNVEPLVQCTIPSYEDQLNAKHAIDPKWVETRTEVAFTNQEQLDEEDNQAILNAEDPNYPTGDYKLNTNDDG